MCNLYAITKSQEAIRQAAKALRDKAGNLPPLPGIFPDQMAPIVRTGEDGKRELVIMRWGFPSPRYSCAFGIDEVVQKIRDSTIENFRSDPRPASFVELPLN